MFVMHFSLGPKKYFSYATRAMKTTTTITTINMQMCALSLMCFKLLRVCELFSKTFFLNVRIHVVIDISSLQSILLTWVRHNHSTIYLNVFKQCCTAFGSGWYTLVVIVIGIIWTISKCSISPPEMLSDSIWSNE